MTVDTRYPHTYAADYIRGLAGYNENGTKISRSDAIKIRTGIATALDIDADVLACRLADHYKKHEEEITNKGVAAFMAAFEVIP